MISLETAYAWTKTGLSIALALQTLEYLWMRKEFSEQGVWRWQILREEFSRFSRPVFRAFAGLFHYPVFLSVLTLRLIAAFSFPFVPPGPLAAGILFFSSLLIALRFRGTFNGGSDYMTLILTTATLFAGVFHETPWSMRFALLYIGVQSLASYVVGGWAKLKSSHWRNGTALPIFLRTPHYDVPGAFVRALSAPTAARTVSALTLLFEVGFPALLFFGPSPWIAIGAGALFHAANAVVLGLNRFFWIWIATYPALLFLTSTLK